ncbi:MAG: ATP-binding cassette domain-containing protein [Bacteroidota bacterium]|nr:ATP-binding cassette domain-containing protein [Bacteroidota bacterium]
MVKVSHLRKTYGNIRAVDDVSFAVSPGQVFGLIGPNGAGKTTTIRMILDIVRPDEGSIEIDGHRPGADVRDIVGYVPEERGLYRKSTLGNVIAYFASLRGMDRRSALAAAIPWLKRFGLREALNRKVEELSKGNQQKVQFLIAILHQPRLIVLDEVFAGLDPVNQALVRDAIDSFRGQNRTVIFSTHQMEHAERLCDDLVLIDRGKVVLSGSPASIKRRFGKNAIHISFTGNGDFLRTLPGVEKARVDNNFAELILARETDPDPILHAAVRSLRIHSYACIDPSLETVFIDTVGAPSTAVGAPPPPIPTKRQAVSSDPRLKKLFLSILLGLLLVLTLGVKSLREPMPEPLIGAALIAAWFWTIFRFFTVKRKLTAEREAMPKEERSG